MARRKNPLTDLILGKVVDLAADHYSGKKNMKRKNPLASSSYIPVKIEGNKLKMRLPNRNPGTLRQASNIAKKFGVKKNPETSELKDYVVIWQDYSTRKSFNVEAKDHATAVKKAKKILKDKLRISGVAINRLLLSVGRKY